MLRTPRMARNDPGINPRREAGRVRDQNGRLSPDRRLTIGHTAAPDHRRGRSGSSGSWVLGEKVELLAGWIRYGCFPFSFSEEAVAAAWAVGIELDEHESGPGYRLASVGMPPRATTPTRWPLPHRSSTRHGHDRSRPRPTRAPGHRATTMPAGCHRPPLRGQQRGTAAPDDPECRRG